MKKRVAYILFVIFITSFSLELYRNIAAAHNTSMSLTENEENDAKKQAEEADTFCKDKLVYHDCVFAAQYAINQKYKTANLLKLPSPYVTLQIRPPEFCAVYFT
jgi:hypothetical protein